MTTAEECNIKAGTCFGLHWKTATEKDVQDWLKHQGNVNAVDKSGNTPLDAAKLRKSQTNTRNIHAIVRLLENQSTHRQ